jgi:hypothetical protein
MGDDIPEVSQKRRCLGAGCAKDASTLQCPVCLKLGLANSYFCSQDCFSRSWVRRPTPILQEPRRLMHDRANTKRDTKRLNRPPGRTQLAANSSILSRRIPSLARSDPSIRFQQGVPSPNRSPSQNTQKPGWRRPSCA